MTDAEKTAERLYDETDGFLDPTDLHPIFVKRMSRDDAIKALTAALTEHANRALERAANLLTRRHTAEADECADAVRDLKEPE